MESRREALGGGILELLKEAAIKHSLCWAASWFVYNVSYSDECY